MTVIADGERARAILDDPLVVRAFSALDEACIAEFRRAGQSDDAIRDAYLLIQIVEKFKACFGKFINDAVLAEARDKQRARDEMLP